MIESASGAGAPEIEPFGEGGLFGLRSRLITRGERVAWTLPTRAPFREGGRGRAGERRGRGRGDPVVSFPVSRS
jgi:hypothetical protein